jgi:hypothetical protein
MDTQFKVDTPRITFFVDELWIPSSDPSEVWDQLILEYAGDMGVVTTASQCFKQSFLSDYYIHELTDIEFNGSGEGGENLLSHGNHKITLNTLSGLLTITKDFIYTIVLDGDVYNIDYCVLTIVYDPYIQKEVNCNWHYTIDHLRPHSAVKKSLILEKDFFEI